MTATIAPKTVTITYDLTNGEIMNVQADLWQTTDANGSAIEPQHIGTKNGVTAADIGAWYPHADLAAQVSQLQVKAEENTALIEQVRTLRGVPKFSALDLLQLITDTEKDQITQFVAGDDTLRQLWSAFLSRVAGPPISIDSPTFLAALNGLKQALGEARVTALFAALNIDILSGAYINPAQAA